MQELINDLPIYAKLNNYELESVCGLTYTYPCADVKFSSRYDYGLMTLMVFRVYKIKKEEDENKEENEEDEYGENEDEYEE